MSKLSVNHSPLKVFVGVAIFSIGGLFTWLVDDSVFAKKSISYLFFPVFIMVVLKVWKNKK